MFVIPNFKFVGFIVRLLGNMLHNFLFHFSFFYHKTNSKWSFSYRKHDFLVCFFCLNKKCLFNYLVFDDDFMRL